MSKGTNQKLKMLYLRKLLLENTDEMHSITAKELIEGLESYGINAERKSIYSDIEYLRVFGMDIIGERQGRNYCYHVGGRRFEPAELKLLVDAIQSSKFITEKKSRELIRKLMTLTSRYEASQLRRQVVVSGRIKTMNESIYYNVDRIHSAINENRRIRFEYLRWNLRKRLVPRRKGFYEVSPWALVWNDENYYLVAFDSVAERLKHYRVDKMRGIELTGQMRDGREHFKASDMAVYTRKNFGMFSGEEQKVRLCFRNELVGVLLDRFGKDIPIRAWEKEGWSETSVDVAVSGQFFGWIFALGTGVFILSPASVAERFHSELRELEIQYAGREEAGREISHL